MKKNITETLYRIRQELDNGIKAKNLSSKIWDPESKSYTEPKKIGDFDMFPSPLVILPSPHYNVNQPRMYA